MLLKLNFSCFYVDVSEGKITVDEGSGALMGQKPSVSGVSSGQISSLQATQMTQEAAIRDLDNERSRLKDKVVRMEEERESLLSQCQALEDRQNQQVHSLEKVCVCVCGMLTLAGCDSAHQVVLLTQTIKIQPWNFPTFPAGVP